MNSARYLACLIFILPITLIGQYSLQFPDCDDVIIEADHDDFNQSEIVFCLEKMVRPSIWQKYVQKKSDPESSAFLDLTKGMYHIIATKSSPNEIRFISQERDFKAEKRKSVFWNSQSFEIGDCGKLSDRKIGIYVHPNPVENEFRLLVDYTIHQNLMLKIFDVDGNIKFHSIMESNEFLVSTAEWPSGIYLIHVIDDDPGPPSTTRFLKL